MNSVIFSICAAAIITAVYKALAPADKYPGQIKLLISCFFVVSVISAVSGMGGFTDLSDILGTDTSYNDYSVQIRAMTEEETAGRLRTLIYEKLAEENIVPEKIYIDVNISDKGSISISEIKLVFGIADYERNAQRAVALVRRITGTGIKVTAELTPQAKKEREDQ